MRWQKSCFLGDEACDVPRGEKFTFQVQIWSRNEGHVSV